MDGDGRADLLVAARGDDDGGSEAGAAYLVLGGVAGTLDLSAADAKLVGENAGDSAGSVVAEAGDVDGDGLADLLVGAPGNDDAGSDSGATYVVLGEAAGTLDLSAADAKLVGEDAGDWAGSAVAGAGDVDGDGRADLLIGALYDDDGGTDAGAAYVVLGGVAGALDLSAAAARLIGEGPSDWAGSAVAGAGDVDGDGRADLLVGAQGDDDGGKYAGAAYLVLGAPGGTVDLGSADAKLVGIALGDVAGALLAGAGDLNGDAYDDLAVSAPDSGSESGAVYLLLGGGL
jgi:hypothetical protein